MSAKRSRHALRRRTSTISASCSQLCEQELIDREKRAADRRLKAAKFPNHKTLEDFKFAAQPTINRVLVSELMRGEYIEKRESVILIGHPGCVAALANGLSVRCAHGRLGYGS